MGFASTGACFPTQQDALDNWCANVTPGNTFASCESCDHTTSSCIVYDASNQTSQTVAVATPSCTEPTPIADASAYAGAITTLWIAVWAARRVYDFFNRDLANV